MPQHKLATEVYFDLNDGHKIPALGLGTVPLKTTLKSRTKLLLLSGQDIVILIQRGTMVLSHILGKH